MNASTTDFLVELGTEELPPTSLKVLSDAFTQGIINGLSQERLNFNSNAIQTFATPRRLAVIVADVDIQQADQAVEKLGPAIKAAYDKEGNPSKAAEGFARSNGVKFDQLEKVDTDKGERLCYKSIEKGQPTTLLLEKIVAHSLSQLPIAKRMRWGSSRTEFVRPAHWLVMLFGDKVVDATVLGLKADRLSFGHRFHAPETLTIASANAYEQTLEEQGSIIASFDKRRTIIKEQVKALANTLKGEAVTENDLLDEVTALVEKPVALAGKFDAEFLDIPNEALIYSMSEHQKYFHVVASNSAKKNQLLPYFITVSNIESKDPSSIISGNERVIRPRLADAAFFFETDKKLSLQTLRDRLKPVIFQQQLGTVFEKTERIAKLAESIAEKLGANSQAAKVAGEYCKADLASDMVLEFDKMQGIAGGYYARHEGLSNDIADAIESHYLPKFSGDKVPDTTIACAVALADRLDTLTGIFGIGQEPSGSKDPFALRRAAIGVLQIILQNQLVLNIKELLDSAVHQHSAVKDKASTSLKVAHYIFDRFATYYQEQGHTTEVFQAVRQIESFDALDFNARILAVADFVKQPESESLSAANKRVSNILEKSDNTIDASNFEASLLKDDYEKALANAVTEKENVCAPLFEQNNYREGLLALTELKTVVDDFFDHVMVNAEDETIKNNRLALLAKLRRLFLKVADVSFLVPSKTSAK